MSVPVKVVERLMAERTGIELGDGLRERLAAHLDQAARAHGQTPARFAASLATWLAPGGLVFLGYAEAVLPPTPRLRFQLGVAPGAVEDRRGARRAYAAGLAALERCDRHATQARLGGWAVDEPAGVLRGELGRP